MSTADPIPSEITGWERETPRRAFDMLPKVAERDDNALERRNDIPPEWVMAIIADSFGRYDVDTEEREHRTILTGRVVESRH